MKWAWHDRSHAMKKLNPVGRKWHILRARNEWRRRGRPGGRWSYGLASPSARHVTKVQIWQGGDPEWAISLQSPVVPPRLLCFDRNRPHAFDFFSHMRRNFNRGIAENTTFVHRTRPGAYPQIPRYVDMSMVSEISTAAAVIMAAEYERMAIVQGTVPPTVDLDRWNDQVFMKLYQIGFFEITGHAPNTDRLTESGASLTMRIVRSTSSNDLEEIDEALQQLFAFLGPTGQDAEATIIEFLTALSEAMTNVTNHAYNEDMIFDRPNLESFWVAATADRSDNSLTIVVYDQGATIPATYPRHSRLDQVKRYLARALRPEPEGLQDDGTYIRAAMRYGGSRTDQKHRGKGLPQMFSALQKIGRGTLSIYSRGGWCRRTSEGRMRSGAVETPIGGTLIEWSVVLS